MKPQLTWLDDPQTFRVNQSPAVSDHHWYQNTTELAVKHSSFQQSLNGTWAFQYATSQADVPVGFYQPDFDASAFETIKVPQHIALADHDQLAYVNMQYPWEGHTYRRPRYAFGSKFAGIGSFANAKDNPVGCYRTHFDLPEQWATLPVHLRFAGAEVAIYVWCNGHFVGYAEDSFTPSIFDLTPWLQTTDNLLAVACYKRSTASWIEDQDFFRFFGIFRDVDLLALPATHVNDLSVIPTVDNSFTSGQLAVSMQLSPLAPDSTVHLRVLDATGKQLLSQTQPATAQLTIDPIPFAKVHLWSHDDPYCYQLLIETLDANGQVLELVPQVFGFRRIEIKDRVMLLNGQRLIITGVNRHEWSAESGRSVTVSEMQQDIATFKANHINAVRTCHYPDHPAWYDLCDHNGIYVMAETNMESHGSWPDYNVPGDHPEWEAVVLDRAHTNYETFKNHVSILWWSLGNESYAGTDIVAMNQYFKAVDPHRLVHYEGVSHRSEFKPQISDIESRMYATPDEIVAYFEQGAQKPFISCEFMHNMGNSLGGMQAYMDLLTRYPGYQGGFIWDFIDQALWQYDPVTHQRQLGYGGDFDERPSDYEFSGDGLLFADRTEKPAMQEVRYYYGQYTK